jgi:hypothetical protein
MGHVARHCEAKLKKVVNKGKSNHAPDHADNKLSTTMWRIWIAKDAHVGGASRSKPSIFDMLIDATKDTGEGLVSTELGLSHQNPSPSSEPSSLLMLPLPLTQAPVQGSHMDFYLAD